MLHFFKKSYILTNIEANAWQKIKSATVKHAELLGGRGDTKPIVQRTLMTERYRSFCSTYSFSHGIAIPLPHLENVFHGYLMHLVTLWQGDPQPIHHATAVLHIQQNKVTICYCFLYI